MGLKRTNQPKMLFLYDCSKNDDLCQFGYWFGERRKARAAGGLRSASQSNTQLGMEETGKSVSDTGYAHGQSSSETTRSCSKAAMTYSIQHGMLKFPCPLKDVYEEFRDRRTGYMDTIRESIEAESDRSIHREKQRASREDR